MLLYQIRLTEKAEIIYSQVNQQQDGWRVRTRWVHIKFSAAKPSTVEAGSVNFYHTDLDINRLEQSGNQSEKWEISLWRKNTQVQNPADDE